MKAAPFFIKGVLPLLQQYQLFVFPEALALI